MPAFHTVIVILAVWVGVPCLLALAWLAWRHFTLGRWPEFRWALTVLAHEKQLQNRGNGALRRLKASSASLASQVGPLWDRAAGRAWSLAPVDELEKEPNIGPATVELLKNARLLAVRDVENHSQLQTIPGIGRARAGFLRKALARCKARIMSGLLAPHQESGQPTTGQVEALRHQFEAGSEAALGELLAVNREWAHLLPEFALARWYWWKAMLSAGRPPVLPHGFRPFQAGFQAASPPTPPPAATRAPSIKSAQADSPPARPPNPEPLAPPSAREVFEATARLAVAAGYSDGRLVDSERAELRAQLQAAFGSNSELAPLVGPFADSAERIPLADMWPDLLRLSMDQRRIAYRICCRVADAAGTRNARESQFLEEVMAGLGLSLRSPVPPPSGVPLPDKAMDVEGARRLLEIDPVANLEIDLVRRQLRLHQERAAAVRPGSLGPEIESMLEERKESLARAAACLADYLGQPLDAPEKPRGSSTDPRHNPDLDAALGL